MYIKNYISSKISDRFEQIMKKKSENYGIFDIKHLSYDYKNMWTQEYYCANGYYGTSTILKRYANIDNSKRIKASIEHGIDDREKSVIIGDICAPMDTILTFSDFRKNMIERFSTKKAIVIGPYIAYAESYYSKLEIEAMRKRNGRTLLVFPTHSTRGIVTNYDFNSFINEIRNLGESFDTILICLYWRDIAKGVNKYYQKEGFRIVSAGHIYDVNFLKRLHSIFELADGVIFNEPCTAVGYAMQLQKPCYIFNQKMEYCTDLSQAYLERDFTPEHYEVIKAFSKPEFAITEEQKKISNYVYGIGQIKSPQQLREIIEPYLE